MSALSCLRRLVVALLLVGLVATGGPALAADPTTPLQGTPSIDGQAVEGETLTAIVTPAEGAPAPSTVSYQWLVGGVPVLGETAATFVPRAQDVDAPVTVQTTVTEGEATDTATSAATPLVQPAPRPTISGTLAVGSTVRARTDGWAPGTEFSYRWLANGQPIAGAINPAHKLLAAQGTRRLSVRVTATIPGYEPVVRTSASTPRIVTAAATPRITGSAAVGRTLTVQRGTWMNDMTFQIRWYADGELISGAYRSTLKVPYGVVLKRVTVKVTGSRSGYATVSKESSTTPRIQRIGTPSLSGSTVATRRLTANPGTWSTGTSLTYQWYLSGKKISGATSRSVYVKPSWKGKTLKAAVTGRRSGFSTFTVKTGSSSRITLPSRTAPTSEWNCPSWAPIKGNRDSWIYHMPGQRFYKATKPEECFRTESAARAAGYRKAKV